MSAPTTPVTPQAPAAPGPTPIGLAPAVLGLRRALDTPRGEGLARGSWRWTVRQRMAALRDALVDEMETPEDGWLAARGSGMLRERDALLARLSALGPKVLESPQVERVHGELERLLTDVAHHVQRLHDLAYDAVELELGGED